MASAKQVVESATIKGKLRKLQERFQRRNIDFTCFFCCHVRTGTIVIGFWHILLHLIALALIAIVLIHPEMLMASGSLSMTYRRYNLSIRSLDCGDKMPCFLADNSPETSRHLSLPLGNVLISRIVNTDEVYVVLFVTLCTFVVTLLLVYGAFCRQPSHLTPFFFLQLFTFCISSMTMICYVSYLPNIRQLIRDTPPFPLQQQLLQMETKCLIFVVMIIFIIILTVQCYFISIVGRCYTFFLILNNAKARCTVFARDKDQESQSLIVGDDVPDFNTVISDLKNKRKLRNFYSEPPPSSDASLVYQHQNRKNTDTSSAAIDVAGAVDSQPQENHKAANIKGIDNTSAASF